MQLSNEKLAELSLRFGDAFYLLDSEGFRKNFRELKQAFAGIYPRFNIAYSYKTNYIPKLCRIVNEEGGYAEVVSEMELEIALRIGVTPEKIIWNGPVKNREKAEELLLSGGTVNIDSYEELLGLTPFLDEHSDQEIYLGIRCNFPVGDGVISRFGIDTESEDFERTVRSIAERKHVKLINLQCHFAKRSIEFWPARAEGMINVAEKVRAIIGFYPERIDLGGGLYGRMEPLLKKQFRDSIPEYTDYAHAVAEVIRDHFGTDGPELLIEPGSALAGDCMKFVSKVKSMKQVQGKTFITVMGSQKNISMSGINPPIEVFRKEEEAGEYFEDAEIVGYTCIEGDVLYKGFTGKLTRDDYIVLSNCGSYSVVMKPPFILPNFPVLDLSAGEAEVIKRAEKFEDIFKTYAYV